MLIAVVFRGNSLIRPEGEGFTSFQGFPDEVLIGEGAGLVREGRL